MRRPVTDPDTEFELMSDSPKDNPSNEWDRVPTVARGGAMVRVNPTPNDRALSLDLQQAGVGGEEEEGVDALHYWRIILKRRWTVISVVAAAVAMAVIQTMMTKPMYRATTTIQIDAEPIRVIEGEGVLPREDYTFMPTQLELLRSRGMAERVARAMNLAADPAIASLSRPSPLAMAFYSVFGGGPETSKEAQAGDEPAADDDAPRQVAAVDDAENERRLLAAMTSFVMSGLSVSQVPDSRLVRISFESPDPDLSARISIGVAEEFIQANLDRRMDASSFAKRWLETSLADAKARLEASERALIEFAQREQLFEVEGQTPMANQTLADLNAAISAARADRIKAEARLKSVQSGPLDAIPEVLGSDLINRLKESRSVLAGEYQQKLATFKPDFPEMRRLQNRIDEIDRQIAAATQTIKASIEAEYRAALQREELLSQQIDSVRTEALDVRGRSIEYNILKREVDTNRQQYEGLLQRFKEVGLAGGVGTNNISIVDRAEVPGGPFKPSLATNVQAGLLLGLILGVLLALLIEYLDDTVKIPEDVERKLRMPLLGVIPKLKVTETVASAMDDQRSAFSEAYRSLRTALQFATDKGVPRTLLVTSSSMAEGKSTTAFVLACNFAALGKKVLLLDCDLRNPSLHKRIPGAMNVNGLSNYLAGAIKPQEMVVATGIENLSFAPTGPLPPNPAELLASPRMSALLTVASHKFDIVIMDGPPVMGLADVPILAHLSAGTLIVVEAGETRVGIAVAAIKRLQAARARIVGTVLTKYDARGQGYGYGYGYGYSYSYAYYSYGATSQKQLGRS
jgi:capsular exopolysaccharide synthesis family protein